MLSQKEKSYVFGVWVNVFLAIYKYIVYMFEGGNDEKQR